MKAFYQLSYKKADHNKFGELPDPVPQAGELLISVKAASLNPVDYKLRDGSFRLLVKSRFPKIVGTDFAGIVVGIGEGVTQFNIGDNVYGVVSAFSGKNGTLAELITVDEKAVRIVPDWMILEDAASLPVAALTALNGLRRCGITVGSRLLINGATGGVGHFAVQIAKAKGTHITSVCSEKKKSFAAELGSDIIYTYDSPALSESGKKFDSILDVYGNMSYSTILKLLKPRGIYASPLFMPPSFIPAFFISLIFNRKLTSSNMRALPEDYAEIEKLMSQGKLKPVIDTIFSLDKSAEAFQRIENGKPKGKVIIRIGN